MARWEANRPPVRSTAGPGGQEVLAGVLDVPESTRNEKPQANGAVDPFERVRERGVAECADLALLVEIHEDEARFLLFKQAEKDSSSMPQVLEGRVLGVTAFFTTSEVTVAIELQDPRNIRRSFEPEPPAPTLSINHSPRTQEPMTALCLMSQACRSYPVQQALMDSAIGSLPPRRDIDAYTHPPPPRTKPKSNGNKKVK